MVWYTSRPILLCTSKVFHLMTLPKGSQKIKRTFESVVWVNDLQYLNLVFVKLIKRRLPVFAKILVSYVCTIFFVSIQHSSNSSLELDPEPQEISFATSSQVASIELERDGGILQESDVK